MAPRKPAPIDVLTFEFVDENLSSGRWAPATAVAKRNVLLVVWERAGVSEVSDVRCVAEAWDALTAHYTPATAKEAASILRRFDAWLVERGLSAEQQLGQMRRPDRSASSDYRSRPKKWRWLDEPLPPHERTVNPDVVQWVDRYIASRTDWSDATCFSVRVFLMDFARHAAVLSEAAIEEWLASKSWSAATRRLRMYQLGPFTRFLAKHGAFGSDARRSADPAG